MTTSSPGVLAALVHFAFDFPEVFFSLPDFVLPGRWEPSASQAVSAVSEASARAVDRVRAVARERQVMGRKIDRVRGPPAKGEQKSRLAYAVAMSLSRSLRPISLTALVGTLIGLQGCEPKQHDPSDVKPVLAMDPTATPTVAPREVRPSEPRAVNAATQIALTALSRVRALTGVNRSIDLRIDALDAAGASVRMAGELQVTVVSAGSDPERFTFNINMTTRAQEATYYNSTLEVYVVRVEPKFVRLPRDGAPMVVSLSLITPAGETLQASGTVTW